MKRLSIIVPMYNVAPYVERCIRSLEDQDLPKNEYEIICVNDGSPDNCKEIIQNLQKEFNNVILIDQENQGVSMARNNAIDRARGAYILPIDPDDYILPNTLELFLQQAEKNDLDAFFGGFEIFNVNGKSIWKTDYSVLDNTICDGVHGYFAATGPNSKDPDRSVAVLYRKELLEQFQIRYPKHVPYLEDGLFLGLFFSVALKIGFWDFPFYQRTTRIGSATNSGLFRTTYAKDGFLIALKAIEDFKKSNAVSQSGIELLNHVIVKFATLPLISSLSVNFVSSYNSYVKILRNSGYTKLPRSGVKRIYRDLAKWYNISPSLMGIWYIYTLKINRK